MRKIAFVDIENVSHNWTPYINNFDHIYIFMGKENIKHGIQPDMDLTKITVLNPNVEGPNAIDWEIKKLAYTIQCDNSRGAGVPLDMYFISGDKGFDDTIEAFAWEGWNAYRIDPHAEALKKIKKQLVNNCVSEYISISDLSKPRIKKTIIKWLRNHFQVMELRKYWDNENEFFNLVSDVLFEKNIFKKKIKNAKPKDHLLP